MSMGRLAKLTLAVALLLSAFTLAYVRITDSISDFEMQWMMQHTNSRIEQIEPEPQPDPQEAQPSQPESQPEQEAPAPDPPRPSYLQDKLITT